MRNLCDLPFVQHITTLLTLGNQWFGFIDLLSKRSPVDAWAPFNLDMLDFWVLLVVFLLHWLVLDGLDLLATVLAQGRRFLIPFWRIRVEEVIACSCNKFACV